MSGWQWDDDRDAFPPSYDEYKNCPTPQMAPPPSYNNSLPPPPSYNAPDYNTPSYNTPSYNAPPTSNYNAHIRKYTRSVFSSATLIHTSGVTPR